ncbi:MAG: hypothetical protein KAT28_03615 [Candidatus Aenigmarchaeota archaeon]|nr:hypothetical protein [Candidatus Aenigmarchaeota archaeon]
MNDVKILDRKYPEIEKLVLEIRDNNNVNSRLRKKVYKLGSAMGEIINDDGYDITSPSLMSLLRAGEPLGNGVDEVYQCDKIAYMSARRDEKTLKPCVEYLRIPDINGTDFILADSMCATGGSVIGSLEILEAQKDCCGTPNTLTLMFAISSKYGIEKILEKYGNKVNIVTGTMITDYVSGGIGPGLDNRGYIINPYGEPRDLGDDMFGEPKNQEYKPIF